MGKREPTQVERLYHACATDHEASMLDELCIRAGILWKCEADNPDYDPPYCGAQNWEDEDTCAECGADRWNQEH